MSEVHFFSCNINFLAIYHPKLKIFLDVKDDDNYDEEGGNQPEKTLLLNNALKPLKRFKHTANFMMFKIRSITASE